MTLFDDKSIDKFDYRYVKQIEHLKENLEYKKLIKFIEEELNLYGATFSNIDYESAKLILDYAKNNNMAMYNIIERKLLFLSRLPDKIAKKLFEEYKLGNNLDEITSIMDSEFYRTIINTFRELIPYTDEELRNARKSNIEQIISNNELYFSQSLSLSRIIGQTNYYDYKEKEYIYNSSDSFESADTIIRNVYRDLFSEYIFNDRYQNVSKDISSLMRYAKEQGKTEDIESIEILERVRERLDESGIFGIQFLFERLKDSDIATLLSTYQNKYQQETYSSLVSSATNFTKNSEFYDEIKSKLNECDVYYLDGQEFNAL